jgi:hypothetical protein
LLFDFPLSPFLDVYKILSLFLFKDNRKIPAEACPPSAGCSANLQSLILRPSFFAQNLRVRTCALLTIFRRFIAQVFTCDNLAIALGDGGRVSLNCPLT